MKSQKVLIVTVDEAKEALVQFWADVLADRAHVVELLQEGKLDIPRLAEMDAAEIASQYSDLCLGDKLLKDDASADLVVVQVGEWSYECAVDKSEMYRPSATDPAIVEQEASSAKKMSPSVLTSAVLNS